MKTKIGAFYTHYKNKKLYKVLNIATHTETGEMMVVYEAQYDDPEFGPRAVWVRPQAMFEELVPFEDELVDRFKEVEG